MPLIFIVIPLAGVILLNLPYLNRGGKAAFRAASFISLLQMLLSAYIGLFGSENIQGLNRALDIGFGFNAYSILILFLIGLISFVSFIMGASLERGGRFHFSSLMLLVVMGMNGIASASDLFSLYVFLEITAVGSFILIAQQRDPKALAGSFRYFVMSAAATVFILAAYALIFISAGSLKYADVVRYAAETGGVLPLPMLIAAVLLLTGFSVKAGLVPFHGWLPEAYTWADPAVSVLLAGIVTKVAGVYSLFIVFDVVFHGNPVPGAILMLAGLASIVAGALAAIGQNDFKRMLAFSSISQVGYIILGIGVGTPLALLGAFFHFFNHAVFKSLLFVNSAAVEKETGTRRLDRLGGLARKMPVTGGTSVVGFLSAAGIPPLSGFWSKLIIIIAAWQAGAPVHSIIALLSGILTLAYFLILQRRVFFGETPQGLVHVTEADAGTRAVELALSGVTVLVGILFPFICMYFGLNGLVG